MKKWTFAFVRLSPADSAIFAVYAVMVAVGAWFHEPWADEAQAWLLARDLSIPQLLLHNLRYEGHPALWYLLLWAPIHLHLPYAFFNWISASIALAGIYVFLRLSPFPLYLRALIPFSFFLAYEYAVVARSYVLFPILCFLLAHFYRAEKERPVAVAIVLSLLTNLSVHGAIVAICFGALYLRKVLKSGGTAEEATERSGKRKMGAAIFLASLLFMLICLWPAANSVPRPTPTWAALISRLALPIGAASHPGASLPVSTTSMGKPDGPAPAAVSSAAPATPTHGRLANVLPILTYAFSGVTVLALAFDCVLLYYLWRRRAVALLLPFLALYLFLLLFFSAPWHLGLLWVLCITIVWLAWDASCDGKDLPAQKLVAVFLALLCVIQIPGTAKAFVFDVRNPTSPDKAIAARLKTFPNQYRIAAFGMSNGVQPYFAHNIFLNQEHTFTLWQNDVFPPTLEQVLAERPEVVVGEPGLAASLPGGAYHAVQTSCGWLYFPHKQLPPGCLTVFERTR